jgi:tRNA-uridine 2-sulfurtransferase
VTGIHLALSANPSSYRTGARGCCTLEDARDARRAADVIGIPFYVWDMAERFAADVVDDFIAEYARGNTPNPCLRCNEKIKFAAVLDRAVALGFDAVCTGHYARLEPAADPARGGVRAVGCAGVSPAQQSSPPGQHRPGPRLVRSLDAAKDQSYVLAVLTSEQLSHAMFPLGDSTKAQVRAEAAWRGLAVADKPDSHDVCFIADGDTTGFLRSKLGSAPGPIVDEHGQAIGSHDGTYGFTVGQRRGLAIGTPAADGKPRYVLDIEPVSATVRVGPAAALDVDEITAIRPVWTGCEPPEQPIEADVQLRAHGETHRATCRLDDGGGFRAVGGAGVSPGQQSAPPGQRGDLRIRLHSPARGVARGQAAVLYDGQAVLGSATIASTARATVALR